MFDAFIIPRIGKPLKSVSLEDVKLNKKSARGIWIDITDCSRTEISGLGKIFNLHALTLEDLFRRNVRTKLEAFREYTFIILYGIKREKRLSPYEIDFIIGKNFVISSHSGKIGSYEKFKEDKEKIEMLLKASPDFLLHRLFDLIVDEMLPIFEKIDKEVDDIEQKVVNEPSDELLNGILGLRTELVDVRRLIPSQREVIAAIIRGDSKFITKSTAAYFRDLHDNIIRINEKLDNSRESLRTILDIYILNSGSKTNEVIKMLTIIATIILPLSLISGIFGMNFAIPFFQREYGFYYTIVLMAILVFGMLSYFIRKGWLKLF